MTIASDCFGIPRDRLQLLLPSDTGGEPERFDSPFTADHEARIKTNQQAWLESDLGRLANEDQREIKLDDIRREADAQVDPLPIAHLRGALGGRGFANVAFTAVDSDAWPEPTFNHEATRSLKGGCAGDFVICINKPKYESRKVKLFGLEFRIREAGNTDWCELGASPLDRDNACGLAAAYVIRANFNKRTLRGLFELQRETVYELTVRFVFNLGMTSTGTLSNPSLQPSPWASMTKHTNASGCTPEELTARLEAQIAQNCTDIVVLNSSDDSGDEMEAEVDEFQNLPIDLTGTEVVVAPKAAAVLATPAPAANATALVPAATGGGGGGGGAAAAAAAAATDGAAVAAAAVDRQKDRLACSILKTEAIMLAELLRLDRAAGGAAFSIYFADLKQAGINNVLLLSKLTEEDLAYVPHLKDEPPLKKRKIIQEFASIQDAGSRVLPVGAADDQQVCPFSQRPFVDRVRFASEATRALDPNYYERVWIEEWFALGHDRSVLTNAHLVDQTLESVPM